MLFLFLFIATTSGLFSQNLFFVNVSTSYSSDFRDSLIDKKLVLPPVKGDEDFKFDNLIINNNINEKEIENVEEGDEWLPGVPFSLTPPPPVNLGGDGKIKIIRKDTGERIEVRYRNEDGSYNEDAFKQIKHIMRCSLTGFEVEIPAKLIELLDAVEDKFAKGKGIILLSGYRTKPLNDITPGAAKHSLHMLGWASDVKIIGVPARKIRDFARRLKVGGVGYYPRYGFVHLDIGRVRYWEKYQYRKKNYYARSKRKNTGHKNYSNLSHNRLSNNRFKTSINKKQHNTKIAYSKKK